MLSRIVIMLALLGVVVGAAVKFWPEPGVREQHGALAEALLTSFERDDYALFVQNADRGLSKLRREDFALLAGQHAEQLKGGHTLDFLGTSERAGLRQSRWRVIFNAGGEVPLTLGVRDGRVATLAFR